MQDRFSQRISPPEEAANHVVEKAENNVRAYPAPEGEPLSARFKVRAKQANVPVYLARINSLSPEARRSLGSPTEGQTTTTSFAPFDLDGMAKVLVTCAEEIKSVKVLPSTWGLNRRFRERPSLSPWTNRAN